MTQFHVDPSRIGVGDPIVVTEPDGRVIHVEKVIINGPSELVYLPRKEGQAGPHVVLRTESHWVASGAAKASAEVGR